MIFAPAILFLAASQLASAALVPKSPAAGSTCQVSTVCQITWIYDSDPPEASSLGATEIQLVIVQGSGVEPIITLGVVPDVLRTQMFPFTPDPALPPRSQYAILFVPQSNSSAAVLSDMFSITGGDPTTGAAPSNTTGTTGNSTSTNSTNVAGGGGTLPSNNTGTTSPSNSSTTDMGSTLNSSTTSTTNATTQQTMASTHTSPSATPTSGSGNSAPSGAKKGSASGLTIHSLKTITSICLLVVLFV